MIDFALDQRPIVYDARVPEAHRDVVRWSAEALGPDGRAFVAGWPDTVTLAIDGVGDVLFCHATPRNDTEVFTRRTPEATLMPIFEPLRVHAVVCGHTHMQFDRQIAGIRVVRAFVVVAGRAEVDRCRLRDRR